MHFNKVAPAHLKSVIRVWQFFNEQQNNMIFNQEKNQVNDMSGFNKSLFAIASKLDKCLMLVVACGFSLNQLLQEPENNTYVETASYLIKKLQFFVNCTE